MTLFLTSAYLAIRARANSLVRLENEEIDALLQGKKLGTELKRFSGQQRAGHWKRLCPATLFF